MTSDRDWVLQAACRGTDGAMWDTPPQKPGRDRDTLVATARRAFALCAVCPVLTTCAADADAGHVIGVIRAGRAYDAEGRPSIPCAHCGQQVVARNGTHTPYCSTNCNHLAAYHRARTERLAA